MNLEEKLFTGKRKKELGVNLIEKGELKKALKVLQNVNSLFELGMSEPDLQSSAEIKQ